MILKPFFAHGWPPQALTQLLFSQSSRISCVIVADNSKIIIVGMLLCSLNPRTFFLTLQMQITVFFKAKTLDEDCFPSS